MLRSVHSPGSTMGWCTAHTGRRSRSRRQRRVGRSNPPCMPVHIPPSGPPGSANRERRQSRSGCTSETYRADLSPSPSGCTGAPAYRSPAARFPSDPPVPRRSVHTGPGQRHKKRRGPCSLEARYRSPGDKCWCRSHRRGSSMGRSARCLRRHPLEAGLPVSKSGARTSRRSAPGRRRATSKS